MADFDEYGTCRHHPDDQSTSPLETAISQSRSESHGPTPGITWRLRHKDEGAGEGQLCNQVGVGVGGGWCWAPGGRVRGWAGGQARHRLRNIFTRAIWHFVQH